MAFYKEENWNMKKETGNTAMVTNGQIKKIHTLTNLIGIPDDLYREILFENFNVDSSKNLTADNAGLLINILEDKAKNTGRWKDYSRKTLSDREGMATIKQIRKIEIMWKEVAYKKSKKYQIKSLRKFLEKQFKISDIRFIDKKTANKVINAIKALQNLKEK